jgi:hypothetical protein
MTRWLNPRVDFKPAAEQAAHPKSGPRRRPHKLPGSCVTHGDFRRTTHTNCSPRIPVRFNPPYDRDRDLPIAFREPSHGDLR